MPRDPRFIPHHGLLHVVDTTFQNRYLLRPCRRLNQRFTGILAKAQERYDMRICAVVVASTHYHLLLQPRDGAQLAAFMCWLKTNLSKEIGTRLHGWRGRFFARRFRAIAVSEEEVAQVRVLRYILSHGVKENLVDSVCQWPGVHSAEALIDGSPLRGTWHDRTRQYRAHVGKGADPNDFTSQLSVDLSPLPCWQDLSEVKWREAVKELVDSIDEEAAAERRRRGVRSLGVAKVLGMDPRHEPIEAESSPQPRFHVSSQQHLMQFIEAFSEVFAKFHVAAEKLRAGDRKALFPPGTFPPSLPFVPFPSEPSEARGQPA